VLWWARQAAQGTAAIHAEGWVHRDLKPANLLVSPQGHVTILDFGFATQANNVADPVFRGTPQFAAPEVLRGDSPANPAADVYALGCLLQRMLAASQREAPLPEAVEALLAETLAERPQQRPAAASLVDRLLRLEIETLGRHIRPHRRAA
jgi:serine/threonine protein kinase